MSKIGNLSHCAKQNTGFSHDWSKFSRKFNIEIHWDATLYFEKYILTSKLSLICQLKHSVLKYRHARSYFTQKYRKIYTFWYSILAYIFVECFGIIMQKSFFSFHSQNYQVKYMYVVCVRGKIFCLWLSKREQKYKNTFANWGINDLQFSYTITQHLSQSKVLRSSYL